MIRSLLLWTGLGLCAAHAAEHREVHMNNGRVILAEVKSFTPEGVVLALPQGTMRFPAGELQSMESLTEEEYRAQQPWKVVILEYTASDRSLEADAKTAHMLARRALSAIPSVISGTPADIPTGIREADRRSLAACRTDLLCAIREGEAAGVDVVMLGQVRESGGKKELRLGALWVKHPVARKRLTIALTQPTVQHRAEIYASQHRLLQLDPPPVAVAAVPIQAQPAPAPAAEVREAPSPRQPPSATRVRAMAWAPIPGLPHLLRKDHGAFARSLGVAAVGTGLGIGLAGHATYTRGQFITMSVVSSYAITTLANHLFWPAEPQPPPR